MTNKKLLYIIFGLILLNSLLLAKYINEKSITDLSIKLVDYPSYTHEWSNRPYRSNLIVFGPNNDRIRECYNTTLQLHDVLGNLRKQHLEQPQLDAWVSQKTDLEEYCRTKVTLSELEKTEFESLLETFITSFEKLTQEPYVLADVDTTVNIKIDTITIDMAACNEEFSSFKRVCSNKGEFNIHGMTYHLNDLTLIETSLITAEIQLSLNLLWRKYRNACEGKERLVMKKIYPQNDW